MGKNAKLKEKHKWSHEKPKLDNARKLRGIYFIDTEDKEFKETIKNARKKLETPEVPAMHCKIMQKNYGSDAAKAAVDKEWEKLEKIPAWNLTKVRNKSEVIVEARTTGAKAHFASLMDRCHLKHAELEDDSGSYAVFTEQGSSASQLTSRFLSKIADTDMNGPAMRESEVLVLGELPC